MISKAVITALKLPVGGKKITKEKPCEAEVWSCSTGSSPRVSDPRREHPVPSSPCTSVLQHGTQGAPQRSALRRHSPWRGTKRWVGFVKNLQLLFRARQTNEVSAAPPGKKRTKQIKYPARFSLTFSSASVLPSILLMAFWTRARRLDRQSKRLTTFSRSPMNIMYRSNSLGLQTSRTVTSSSSPRSAHSLASERTSSLSSHRVCSFDRRLEMSSSCKGGGENHRKLLLPKKIRIISREWIFLTLSLLNSGLLK